MESGRENVTIQLAGQISYSLCFMSVHIFFQGSIPFAVIGSNTITEVRGKQVRVRQYPWGMAEGLLIIFSPTQSPGTLTLSYFVLNYGF